MDLITCDAYFMNDRAKIMAELREFRAGVFYELVF
jgi:hypothetical protein